jgi:hypothetical protein
MSNMINAKPRFAVDDSDGRVYCYLTNRYFEPTGTKALPDGTWDLAAVKAGILAGTFVDVAKTGTGTATLAQVLATENKLAAEKAAKAQQAAQPPGTPPDKVAQANADFNETVDSHTMSPFQRAQAAIAARQKATPPAIKAPAAAPAARPATLKA